MKFFAVTNKGGLLRSRDGSTVLEVPKDELSESGYEESSVVGDVVGSLTNVAAFVFLVDQ